MRTAAPKLRARSRASVLLSLLPYCPDRRSLAKFSAVPRRITRLKRSRWNPGSERATTTEAQFNSVQWLVINSAVRFGRRS